MFKIKSALQSAGFQLRVVDPRHLQATLSGQAVDPTGVQVFISDASLVDATDGGAMLHVPGPGFGLVRDDLLAVFVADVNCEVTSFSSEQVVARCPGPLIRGPASVVTASSRGCTTLEWPPETRSLRPDGG